MYQWSVSVSVNKSRVTAGGGMGKDILQHKQLQEQGYGGAEKDGLTPLYKE